jgi:2-polyprenyl-3-methyl-5-hydroxy-6-metoxy-1,4-benzoquinol methylase
MTARHRMPYMRTRTHWFSATIVLASMLTVGTGPAAGSQRNEARRILDDTGVKGGLIVHIGCGDGKLTAALHANDGFLVHGLDTDPGNIDQAREHVRSLKLYGKVFCLDKQ